MKSGHDEICLQALRQFESRDVDDDEICLQALRQFESCESDIDVFASSDDEEIVGNNRNNELIILSDSDDDDCVVVNHILYCDEIILSEEEEEQSFEVIDNEPVNAEVRADALMMRFFGDRVSDSENLLDSDRTLIWDQ